MLVLTRKAMEEIQIGSSIKVAVLATSGNRVKLGISCPAGVSILRAELVRRPAAGGGKPLAWPSAAGLCHSPPAGACALGVG
jgi:carbon storage regulator